MYTSAEALGLFLTVTLAGHAGFVVRVTSDDDAAVAEILRRARALKSSAAQ